MVLHHNTCYSSMGVCFAVSPLSIARDLYHVPSIAMLFRHLCSVDGLRVLDHRDCPFSKYLLLDDLT